jgi:hypothetical protein
MLFARAMQFQGIKSLKITPQIELMFRPPRLARLYPMSEDTGIATMKNKSDEE